jgi:hypothetical protein
VPPWLPPLLLAAGAAFVLAGLAVVWGERRAAGLAARPRARAFANAAPPEVAGPTASVAFLGDVQRGIRDVARALAEALPRGRAALLVSSGDLASHGEAPYHGVVAAALDRAGIAVPTLVVPGNHDLQPSGVRDSEPGRRLFEEKVGPRRWTALVAGLRLVGVDDATGPFPEEARAWVAGVLEADPGRPWLLVAHRAPRRLDREGTPPDRDLGTLVALLEARPPVAVVSGHLHDDAEATVAGVRYLVNARGGDFAKRAWRAPPDFTLLWADVGPGGAVVFRRERVPRRRSGATALDQLAVRLWAEGRRFPLRGVAAPVRALLSAFRRRAPRP